MIGAVVILSGWGLFVSLKQVERSRRIQEDISSLEAEGAKIQRENETLAQRISYFATDDYRERIAKSQLDLKKADETVVEIKLQPDDTTGGKIASEKMRQVSESDGSENMPNYKKWWRIFF